MQLGFFGKKKRNYFDEKFYGGYVIYNLDNYWKF